MNMILSKLTVIPSSFLSHSSVYSFGIVLFELLTADNYLQKGEKGFSFLLPHKKVPQDPKPFPEKIKKKFGEWEKIYQMCTSRDPNDRPNIDTIILEIDYLTGKKQRPQPSSSIPSEETTKDGKSEQSPSLERDSIVYLNL